MILSRIPSGLLPMQNCFGHFVGHFCRRQTVLASEVQHGQHFVINAVDCLESFFCVPTKQFTTTTHNAAGVAYVIRREKNSEFVQSVAVAVLKQLIVCRAGNDLNPQSRIVCSLIIPPNAHGAKTSARTPNISSGETGFAPRSSTTRATLAESTSAATRLAPAC